MNTKRQNQKRKNRHDQKQDNNMWWTHDKTNEPKTWTQPEQNRDTTLTTKTEPRQPKKKIFNIPEDDTLDLHLLADRKGTRLLVLFVFLVDLISTTF